MSTGSARTGTVPASGTELAYLRVGEGPPLVIIPGGPRFGFAHLRPALDVLANGHELVYVDERGSGSSPAGDPGQHLDCRHARRPRCAPRRTRAGAGRSAGHSLAAHWSRSTPATRPARVRALVLLNPAPPFAPEHREQFGKEMGSRRTPEDTEETQRVEGSPEFETGDVAAFERYYQLLYIPFFTTAKSPWARSTGSPRTGRRTATPRSGSSPTSVSTHCPRSSAASRVQPLSSMASVIPCPSRRRRRSPTRSHRASSPSFPARTITGSSRAGNRPRGCRAVSRRSRLLAGATQTGPNPRRRRASFASSALSGSVPGLAPPPARFNSEWAVPASVRWQVARPRSCTRPGLQRHRRRRARRA